MKNFYDLEFVEHPSTFGGEYSKMIFENNYGILVYDGRLGKYEVDIIDADSNPIYNTPINNGILSNVSPERITEIMEQIQKL